MNREPRIDRFGDDDLDWLSKDKSEDVASSEESSQTNSTPIFDKPTLTDQLSQILNQPKKET